MARVAKIGVDLEANSAKFTSGLSRADAALAASGQKWKRQLADIDAKFTSLGNMARGVFGGLAAGAAVRALYDVNAEFQRLGASLKTVTGSTASAEAAMQMIKSFAAETPYQLTEVTEAFVKLKALGLDASVESLRSYGNTASAMGKNINQMIEAVADASTGEFERLKEFGIKASSEGDKVKFTFKGVTTEVGKNAAEIEAYLRRIGEVQFGGAMAEQMKTLGGQTSNLKDQFAALFAAIGKAGGNDVMSWFLRKLQNAAEVTTELIKRYSGAAAELKRVNDQLKRLDNWQQKPFYGMFGGEARGVAELKKRKLELEKIIALEEENAAKGKAELNQKTNEGVNDNAGPSKKAMDQIAALQFKEAQLSRTNREQAVYDALQAAGVERTSKEGEAIAAAAGKLYDKSEAIKVAKDAQKKANDEAKEASEELQKRYTDAEAAGWDVIIKQNEAREKIASGMNQEIADNEKLIAALQVSEAEYERVAAMLELVNAYRQAGIELTPEQIEAEQQITDKLAAQRQQMDTLKDKYASLKKLGADLGMTFSSAFEDAIVEGKKFSDVLQSLAQDIVRLMTRMMVTQPLASGASSLFSSLLGGIGSWFGGGSSSAASITGNATDNISGAASSGGFFSGWFADGGYIPPGGWGIAGEAGPEMVFGGKTGATVIPPEDASGHGGNVYHIDARGADASAVTRLEALIHAGLGPGKIEHRVNTGLQRGTIKR